MPGAVHRFFFDTSFFTFSKLMQNVVDILILLCSYLFLPWHIWGSFLSLPNTYILYYYYYYFYYYYYYYYLTRHTFVGLVTCSPFRNKYNLKFQQHKNRKNINNIQETQIKARKARNRSYDVVASRTSFKKYGLEYTEISHLNNSKLQFPLSAQDIF